MYLELLERRKLRKMFWKSFLLFILGMLLLALSFLMKENMEQLSGVMLELMSEGLTVAAWVSLWNAFASLIFELSGSLADIKIYRRIASRDVVFKPNNMSRKLERGSAKENRVNGTGVLNHTA